MGADRGRDAACFDGDSAVDHTVIADFLHALEADDGAAGHRLRPADVPGTCSARDEGQVMASGNADNRLHFFVVVGEEHHHRCAAPRCFVAAVNSDGIGIVAHPLSIEGGAQSGGDGADVHGWLSRIFCKRAVVLRSWRKGMLSTRPPLACTQSAPTMRSAGQSPPLIRTSG